MAKPKPLLIVSDAVSATTGLGRITRDLATRIHSNLGDIYRVGTLGLGGSGSRQFDFPQYHVEGMNNWVLPTLPDVWDDFAGDQKGIIFFIWDASRLGWFARPDLHPTNSVLRSFLDSDRFEKWIYAPVDAEGPNERLTFPLGQTLQGFDRVLAYGKWADGVIRRTLGNDAARLRHLTYLPHGIDGEIFRADERYRSQARRHFIDTTSAETLTGAKVDGVASDEVLIGIVATNQSRKDWALGIEACALLAKTRKIKLWIHVDTLERYWSIPALLYDYGLIDKAVISMGFLPDQKMAVAYSACDLTFGIGLGEGFGFPIHESIACGTPCIHGDYAGAPEWMRSPHDELEAPEFLIPPIAWRFEGIYSCMRPVFSARQWAARAGLMLGKRMNRNGDIDWENLWPKWEAWFREALK